MSLTNVIHEDGVVSKEGQALQIGATLANFMGNLGKKISFLSNIQPQYTNVVAVDIGGQRIKLLKINTTTIPYQIENFAIADLPEGTIVKEEIKNIPLVALTLQELIKEANVNTKSVAIAIPKSLAVIKTVNIDNRLNASEIESKAWIEANRNFPDLIGNIYLDFSLSEADVKDPNQSELVLVASRKDHVDPYLEIIEQAGLKTHTIDVNCYVYERILKRINQNELSLGTIGLMNFNSNLSSLVVIRENHMIHAHDHAFDDAKLLLQVKAYLHDHYNDEVDEKLATDENYFSILRTNLLSHLRHMIHFFYSSKPNITIEKLMISGEMTNIPHLASFIQKEINLKTELANPLRDMSIANHIDAKKMNQYAPELTLCCGLAINPGAGRT